jgi:hypothetical protein
MPEDIELWPPDAHPLIGRSAVSAEMARATTRIRSSYSRFKRNRLPDGQLQNDVFLGGRLHSPTSLRQPSLDPAKKGRCVGYFPRELVSKGPIRSAIKRLRTWSVSEIEIFLSIISRWDLPPGLINTVRDSFLAFPTLPA